MVLSGAHASPADALRDVVSACSITDDDDGSSEAAAGHAGAPDAVTLQRPRVLDDGFDSRACWDQYRVAVADYTRWMDGWGSWGSATYAKDMTSALLDELGVAASTSEEDAHRALWAALPRT